MQDTVEKYDALIRSGARRLTGYQRRSFQAGAIAPMPRFSAEIVWFFAHKGLQFHC
jgi:hypothetical protein